MRTPTRPTPGHGTRARFQRGCDCGPCAQAHLAYCRRRDYLAATGRPLTIPAEPVRQHLQDLMNAGAGWLQLQAAAGCSPSTLHSLLHGTRPTIRRSTATRILALRPGDCIPGKAPQLAVGSVRRVRALYAIGYTSRAISKASGLDDKTIRDLLAGESTTTIRRVADAVAATYRRLVAQPGHSQRAIRRARAEGWHSPAAWDDIDDPQAVPDTGDDDTPTPRTTALAEDWDWLRRQGYTRTQAAARIGVTRPTLEQAITRHQRQTRQLGEAA